MRYHVVVTADAEQDLEEIYSYIARADSPDKAENVIEGIVAAAEELAALAERGSVPKELRAIGIQDYRQVFFKPYRIIYRVLEQQVVIYLIVDGRRDMQSLLSRRLLG